MREKLTGDRTARDTRSKINRALAAWDCDEPELLERKHVTRGIRPMKITRKMVGAEARKNPIGRQQTYELAEENLANLKKRYQAVLLTMADLRDSLKRRKKGLPDDDMRGYTDAEISKLIQNFQTKAEDLRGAIAEYESGNWYKNPARKPTVSRKISQLTREGYPQRQAVAIALSEQRAGKVRANPAAPARQKMLNISWLTAGGARETMSVPVEFVFNETIAGVKKRFFARLEGGMLIVSEYDTGGKVGQVPFTMRSAALDDRKAAKLFVQRMVEQVGPARFLAAIDRFSKIN